jgi:hypothetical protein
MGGLDGRAAGLDDRAHLVPGDARVGHERVAAAERVEVRPAEPDHGHAKEDLARPRRRLGDVHDLGAARRDDP